MRVISGALDAVERIGNRLPDPVTLFVLLSLLVIVVSVLASFSGLQAVHPVDGEVIEVQSLFTKDNLQRMFTDAVDNFTSFPPLGLVLVAMIGIGVADRSGYFTALLKQVVLMVPASMLTATLMFAGVMSSLTVDAGYIILPPLGAILFKMANRNPLAGIAISFAGVASGFGANLLITAIDPMIAGLSTSAAHLLDADYEVLPTANYYFMVASTVMLTFLGTWVNNAFVEPRLGPWSPPADWKDEGAESHQLTSDERSGLKWSNYTFIGLLILLAVLIWPESSIFRDEEGGLQPFYQSMVPIIMILFLVSGVVYGAFVGVIRNDKDAVKLTSEAVSTMGNYIVLAFVAAQFIAYFALSNLGIILAIKGSELLQSLQLSGPPLLIAFIIVSMAINLFIGSMSAKWAIMGPVFVPMLMLMGYSPELIQVAYRIGDSVSNSISPMNPYFPIMIVFTRVYEPRAGIGTIVAMMLPYAAALFVVWSLMLSGWLLLGIPLGPDAPVVYDVASQAVTAP